MHTTTSRLQRASTIGSVLALFFGLLMFASPAQAAVGVTLEATPTTVIAGETFTLHWTSTDAVTLAASGAWSGAKTPVDDGTEDVVTTTAGSFTYTLLATDANGLEATAEVTVTVNAAGSTTVTPNPVTFPDACTVVVPATTGVSYTLALDGDVFDIDADTYDGAEFFGDEPAVFNAEANRGYTIIAGATTTWTYEPGVECFGDIGNDRVVTVKATCSAVTFTNVSGLPVNLVYGSFDEDEADGETTVAAGGSRRVRTSRDPLSFVAVVGDPEEPELVQIDEIAVPQNCGVNVIAETPTVKWPAAKPAQHPTTAPAAGAIADEGGPSLPAMTLLGALALIGVRRSYALGR